MYQTLAMLRCFDGEDCFDAAIEITRHPVCTASQDAGARGTAILEVEDAAVLQVASENAAHMDVFADAFDLRHEVANAAHNEVDLYAGLRGFVEMVDGLLIDKAVGLHDDACGVTRQGVSGLRFDVSLNFGMERKGGDV